MISYLFILKILIIVIQCFFDVDRRKSRELLFSAFEIESSSNKQTVFNIFKFLSWFNFLCLHVFVQLFHQLKILVRDILVGFYCLYKLLWAIQIVELRAFNVIENFSLILPFSIRDSIMSQWNNGTLTYPFKIIERNFPLGVRKRTPIFYSSISF